MRALFSRKRVFMSVFTLLVCAVSTSCVVGGFPGGKQDDDKTIELSNRRVSQQDVMDDCYHAPDNGKGAAGFYKQQWKAHDADRSGALSKSASVIWLTIAGCLIERDPGNYQNYYKYAASRIGDADKRVASAAVYALRGAHGSGAIDLMISEIKKERDFVSPDAVTAIDYFIKTSYYDDQRKSDFSYVVSRMSQLCKGDDPPSVRGFQEACKDLDRLSRN